MARRRAGHRPGQPDWRPQQQRLQQQPDDHLGRRNDHHVVALGKVAWLVPATRQPARRQIQQKALPPDPVPLHLRPQSGL